MNYAAAVRGAGVRQLADRATSARSTAAAIGWSSPRPWATGGSPRSPPTTGATTASSVRSSWPPARCTSAGSGATREQFRIFGGSTDLIRGNTSGSYRRNECLNANDAEPETGCAVLDRLVGTQIGRGQRRAAVPDPEPVVRAACRGSRRSRARCSTTSAWPGTTRARSSGTARAGDDPIRVRTPLQTIGVSIRTNLFGFAVARLDYSIPQERKAVKGLWTFSLGPTF